MIALTRQAQVTHSPLSTASTIRRCTLTRPREVTKARSPYSPKPLHCPATSTSRATDSRLVGPADRASTNTSRTDSDRSNPVSLARTRGRRLEPAVREPSNPDRPTAAPNYSRVPPDNLSRGRVRTALRISHPSVVRTHLSDTSSGCGNRLALAQEHTRGLIDETPLRAIASSYSFTRAPRCDRTADPCAAGANCSAPSADPGRRVPLLRATRRSSQNCQTDMLAAALSCDLTRVATLFYGIRRHGGPSFDDAARKPRKLPQPISRRSRGTREIRATTPAAARGTQELVCEWTLLDKLAASPRRKPSTLLDNCTVLVVAPPRMGYSQGHANPHSIPTILARNARGGFLSAGRRVTYGNVSTPGAPTTHTAAGTTTDFASDPLPRDGSLTDVTTVRRPVVRPVTPERDHRLAARRLGGTSGSVTSSGHRSISRPHRHEKLTGPGSCKSPTSLPRVDSSCTESC